MNDRILKKKNTISENIRETKEERILKRFEENKIKWEKESKILMEKTNKKDTLADQGEKYREKNELNTLLEYLKKEDERKVQWENNLRMEPEKIKFQKTTRKLNIYNKILKENKNNIFDKVFENKEKNNEDYVYVTNKDAKKKEYQEIIVNKIKNNLEFFLSNFAIPLSDNLYIQGKPIEEENVEPDVINKLSTNERIALDNLEKETDPLDLDKPEQANSIEHENVNKSSDDDPIKINCSCINIENNGEDIINKFIFLQNITSSTIIYIISFKNKMKIKNSILKLNDVLYLSKKKNYDLFIFPKTGYIKPGETIKINFNFIFDSFSYSFGLIQIKCFYKNKICKKNIYISINPFTEMLDSFANGKITQSDKKKTKKLIKKNNNFKLLSKHTITQNKTPFPNKQKLENVIKNIYSDYNISINSFENFVKKKKENINDSLKMIEKNKVPTNQLDNIYDKIIGSNICQSDLKNNMNVFFYHTKNKTLQYIKEVGSNSEVSFFNINTDDYINFESNIFNYKLETTLSEPNGIKPTLSFNGCKNREIFYQVLYNYISHLVHACQTPDDNLMLINKTDETNLEYSAQPSKTTDMELTRSGTTKGLKKSRKKNEKNVEKENDKLINEQIIQNRDLLNKEFESIYIDVHTKNYSTHFINHIYIQNKLNNSHIFYFYNYFKIVQYINQYFILDQNLIDSNSPKQNVFIYMNTNLCNNIFLYILDKLDSYFFSENDTNILNNLFHGSKIKYVLNNLTKLFSDYFSSILLSIKNGTKNVYGYLGEIKIGKEKVNLLNSFLVIYLKAFIYKMLKKTYAIYILENENDVIDAGKVVEGEEKVGKDMVDEGKVDKDVANDGTSCKSFDSFFKEKEIYSDICNSICEYKNGSQSEDLQNDEINVGSRSEGNIFLIKDYKMFSQIIYEKNKNQMQINVEKNLEKVKQTKESEKNKVDISSSKDKKGGHSKSKKGEKKAEKKAEKKSEKKSEEKKTQAQPKEDKPDNTELNFTNFHFFKMFEILNIETCIIDDKEILKTSGIQYDNSSSYIFTLLKKKIPKNVEIKVGYTMRQEVYLLLYIFNIISVEHINFLFHHFINPNMLLYIDYLKSNANHFLDIFKNILQFFSMKNYLSKFIFENKIPLSIHHDHCLVNNMELQTDENKETLNFSNQIYKNIRENWITNGIKNESNVDAKYICIISPNIKNEILNFTNINEILEWIKLLNIIIFLNISDVYIYGDLFLLFLFFIYDSDILKGHISKSNAGTTLLVHSNGIHQPSINQNDDVENVCFKIIDIYNIPKHILFLFKFCIFNIIEQYEKYKINIHFPYDIYVKPNLITFQNDNPSLYCLLPYTDYSTMIKHAKQVFIKKYSHHINQAVQNQLANSNTTTTLINGIFCDATKLHTCQDSLKQSDYQNVSSNEEGEGENHKVLNSILNIGNITMSNVLKNVNKKNKILWLCGSFEKYINNDNKNSMEIFNHLLNTSKNEQTNFNNIYKDDSEIYANNLLILNKEIYSLYLYHAPKELRLNFIFNNHHILINIFDNCYFPPQSVHKMV
ncbi:conserved Plasmodium protein, unknown function [Plasmodium vinckei vinckei]|uniref:Uncharacterized protein n=1 Tax=Plasmodium vinckei vinckei TaxID=54757 RepID=A0A449BP47_PLAVN|nr:conserved Plasmodium protein, unknown function [Plasmodium vinckei vinckei]VEV55168.1 conserved Plasmodium protein, unknown function [Plasmodium vinckei vinckei]